MRNEKGSIAIVLIVIMICGFSILYLTNLTLIERTSSIKGEKRLESDLYQTNTIVEATANLFLQKISTTEIPYEDKTLYVLTEADVLDIEKVLNSKILPALGESAKIQLSKLKHSTSLEMLCDEIYVENPFTLETEPNGVDCDATFFSIGIHLAIGGTERTSMNMTLQDMFPEESSTGDIKINTSSLKFQLTP